AAGRAPASFRLAKRYAGGAPGGRGGVYVPRHRGDAPEERTRQRMTRLRMNSDIAAGLFFSVLGGWFGGASVFGLKLGTAFRMGPGYFPAAVGGALLLLGLVIALNGWRAGTHEDWGPVPW